MGDQAIPQKVRRPGPSSSARRALGPGVEKSAPGDSCAAPVAGERSRLRAVLAELPASAPSDASEREARRVGDAFASAAPLPAIRERRAPISRSRGDGCGCARCQERAAMGSVERSSIPLPDRVRRRFEPRFGRDLSAVRVQPDAPEAGLLGARAFTFGQTIGFAPGQYAPGSTRGDRLLAHEIAHTLQQQGSSWLAREGEREPGGSAQGDRANPRNPVAGGSTAPGAGAPSVSLGMCVPSSALTWADFTGRPPARTASSKIGAYTRFIFSLQSWGGRQWIIATFDAKASWVYPDIANPGDRALNGCGDQVRACQKRLAQHPGDTFGMTRSPGCDAASRPDMALKATTPAECDSVVGAECDRVVALDSQRLLHHEQVHFALSCAMARKGNVAIAARPASTPRQVAESVKNETDKQTAEYDSKSKGGCSADGQREWDVAVAAGLPSVTLP